LKADFKVKKDTTSAEDNQGLHRLGSVKFKDFSRTFISGNSRTLG
jgi:hypothetical protein